MSNENEALYDLDDSLRDESAENPSMAVPMRMLRKIPVRLSLEVGEATLPLADLAALTHGSIIELDRQAGELLTIKVNGAVIGRGEVVVAGDNYGLKIVELGDLDVLSP